jgi:helix-turn-helix protein
MLKHEIVIESDVKPRWMRPASVCESYGISMAYLYRLMNAGKFKVVSLKDKGAKRGIRLISRESVEKFFNAQATTNWKPIDVIGPKKSGQSRSAKKKEVLAAGSARVLRSPKFRASDPINHSLTCSVKPRPRYSGSTAKIFKIYRCYWNRFTNRNSGSVRLPIEERRGH